MAYVNRSMIIQVYSPFGLQQEVATKIFWEISSIINMGLKENMKKKNLVSRFPHFYSPYRSLKLKLGTYQVYQSQRKQTQNKCLGNYSLSINKSSVCLLLILDNTG